MLKFGYKERFSVLNCGSFISSPSNIFKTKGDYCFEYFVQGLRKLSIWENAQCCYRICPKIIVEILQEVCIFFLIKDSRYERIVVQMVPTENQCRYFPCLAHHLVFVIYIFIYFLFYVYKLYVLYCNNYHICLCCICDALCPVQN